jgi:uncharacterized protein (DUF1015 family)
MSASKHLNPKQLKLFMTARELMDMPAGDDLEEWRPMSQNEDLYHEKLGESMDNSLYKSIKSKGVQEPVNIEFFSRQHDDTVISDGHHRIAAAHSINPDMIIPIEYGDDKYLYNLGIDPRNKS